MIFLGRSQGCQELPPSCVFSVAWFPLLEKRGTALFLQVEKLQEDFSLPQLSVFSSVSVWALLPSPWALTPAPTLVPAPLLTPAPTSASVLLIPLFFSTSTPFFSRIPPVPTPAPCSVLSPHLCWPVAPPVCAPVMSVVVFTCTALTSVLVLTSLLLAHWTTLSTSSPLCPCLAVMGRVPSSLWAR